MKITTIELIGMLAAVLTTVAFVPQIMKVWKSKSAAGLSLTMYLIFFTGIVLWLIYGFMISSLSMILANIVTGLLTLFIIFFILSKRR